MLNDENPTPYVKASNAVTPTKAKHAHEYIRVFKMDYVSLGPGYPRSTGKHKISLSATCTICGNVKRRGATNVVEVEVSPAEYRAIRDNA